MKPPNGNGIELTRLASSTAHFDFAGDGFAERTGWVAPSDGGTVPIVFRMMGITRIKMEVALRKRWRFAVVTSHFLNKVLFGARVASDKNLMSQWTTLATAYLANLVLVIFIVTGAAAITGYYDPFHEPLVQAALRPLIAFSNLIAFASTYIASLEWTMHDTALEKQRSINRSRGVYLFFLMTFFLLSLFFSAAPFFILSVPILLAGAAVNSALIHLLLSERILRVENKGIQ